MAAAKVAGVAVIVVVVVSRNSEIHTEICGDPPQVLSRCGLCFKLIKNSDPPTVASLWRVGDEGIRQELNHSLVHEWCIQSRTISHSPSARSKASR